MKLISRLESLDASINSIPPTTITNLKSINYEQKNSWKANIKSVRAYKSLLPDYPVSPKFKEFDTSISAPDSRVLIRGKFRQLGSKLGEYWRIQECKNRANPWGSCLPIKDSEQGQKQIATTSRLAPNWFLPGGPVFDTLEASNLISKRIGS